LPVGVDIALRAEADNALPVDATYRLDETALELPFLVSIEPPAFSL